MNKSKENEGLLVVISSPSGGGKTTVRNRLLEILPDLVNSVSCTTRKPRLGEVEGKDYFFISEEDFAKKKENGEFIEHARVFSASYGTLEKTVDELIQQGRDVLLTIDTQGAQQIKSKREAVLIFILPPSLEILKGRLYNRKTDSESEIWKRLKEVKQELKYAHLYDYLVINDHLDMTVEKIKSIILAEKHKTRRQENLLEMIKSSIPEKL